MQDDKLPRRAEEYLRPRKVLRWYLLWAAWRAASWLERRLWGIWAAVTVLQRRLGIVLRYYRR